VKCGFDGRYEWVEITVGNGQLGRLRRQWNDKIKG
jgi:hypothetical protein